MFFPKFFTRILMIMLVSLTLQGCISVKLFDDQLQAVRVEPGKGFSSARIAIIDISGVITDTGSSSSLFFMDSSVAGLAKKLDYIAKDNRYKAVIVRLNTPGGGVTASDIMYHQIQKFSEKEGIPVYMSMQSLAASGGYYIAMAGKEVYATPTAVTGSIGVIATFPEADGLMGKVGFNMNAITSGKNKDAGAFYKQMTPEDRKLFQDVVNEMYEQFLDVIEKNRKNLSEEQIRTLADGRIYTAKQAYESGLVDGIAYLDEVLDRVKKNEKLESAEVLLIKQGSVSPNETIYTESPTSTPNATVNQFNLVNLEMNRWEAQGHAEVFNYLWVP